MIRLNIYAYRLYTWMKSAKSIITKELPKQKLTHDTINKNVIQRAKAVGINVSAVTEYLVKAITHQSNNGIQEMI
jgi:post-segregation antitoxin (ccd killing protein)